MSHITATSQQTRFNHNIDNPTSKDLDLTTLNINVSGSGPGGGKRDILVDAHLQLIQGRHYVLVGRNGVGKSTLLKALGERLIPGIPKNLRLLYLEQVIGEGEARESGNGGGEGTGGFVGDNAVQGAGLGGKRIVDLNPVDYVVKADKKRGRALKESAALRNALEHSDDPNALVRLVRRLKYERRHEELEEAKKTAMLRSGARGLKARKELKELETEIEAEELRFQEEEGQTVIADQISSITNEAIVMLAELDTSLEVMGASTASQRAESVLRGLGFKSTQLQLPLSSLSGGWIKRCTLASVLFRPCDILLLDEPTNFLDLSAVIWLENYVAEREHPSDPTVVVVSHDRQFVDNVSEETIILREEKLETYPGSLTEYYTTRAQQQRRFTRMKAAQLRQEAHIKKTIAGNIKAAKSTGDHKKLKQAASRQKKLDERMGMEVGLKGGRFKLNRDLPGFHITRRAEIEIPQDDPASRLELPSMPSSELRFPGALLSLENLSAGYRVKSEKATKGNVLEGVNLSVYLGAKVGIVGVNGAGKSTLIKCIVGNSSDHEDGYSSLVGLDVLGPPVPSSSNTSATTNISNKPKTELLTTGTTTRHPKLKLGYYSQQAVEKMERFGRRYPKITALQLLLADARAFAQSSGGISSASGAEGECRAILARVGLVGKVVSDVPVSLLSGGQKARLALALIFRRGAPHLLVLDEPTTHLDSDTVISLAQTLNTFQGGLIVVSHDRFFIRAVVQGERPPEFERDGMHDDSDDGFDDDGDGDGEDGGTEEADGWKEGKKGTVYLLMDGALRMLEKGVEEYEDIVVDKKSKAAKSKVPAKGSKG